MPAISRKTDIASVLEVFLDSNEDDLSPNLFSALEEVAEDIDDQVGSLLTRIEELEAELEERD